MKRLSVLVLALVLISCGGRRAGEPSEASDAALPQGADSGSGSEAADSGSRRDVVQAGGDVFDAADAPHVSNVADVIDVIDAAYPVDASWQRDGGSRDGAVADTSGENASSLPTALTVTPQSPKVEIGKSLPLKVTAVYADGSERDVTAMTVFTTPSTAVIVRGNDVVGRSLGRATITASALGLTSQVSVEVSSTWPLLVTFDGVDCEFNHYVRFRARELGDAERPRDVTNYATWKSHNPDVLVFSGSGPNALCVGPGTVTVSADIGDRHGEVTVTLNGPSITGYDLKGPGVLRVGANASLFGILHYSDGTSLRTTVLSAASEFTYVSSNPAVVGLLENDLALGLTPGTAVVSLLRRGSVVANTTVVVSNLPLQSLVITPAAVVLDYPTSADLKATVTLSDGTQADVSDAVEWTGHRVQPDDTLVYEPGLLPDGARFAASKPGSYRVRAVFDATTAWSTVTLRIGSPEGLGAKVRHFGEAVPLGAELPLEAEAYYGTGSGLDVADVVAWRVADPSVARVTAAPPYVQGLKVGTTTLTASLGNISAEPITVAFIDVAPRSLDIAFEPSAAPVDFQQSIVAEVTYADGSAYAVGTKGVWTIADPTIATLVPSSTPGMIRALRPGTTTVTVQYLGLTARTTLTVTP